MVTWIGVVAVIALVVTLLLSPKVEVLRGTPRSRWLSFAGGVAISYVFLKLLPELTHAQHRIESNHPSGGWLWKHMLFLVALGGSAVLYCIEREAKRTKRKRSENDEEARSAAWVFWLHTALMVVYLAFIGYLMFHEERPAAAVAFGGLMVFHFGGIAVSLADDYRGLYTPRGAGSWPRPRSPARQLAMPGSCQNWRSAS